MRKIIILGVLLLIIAIPLVIAFLYRGKIVTPKSVTLNYWLVEGSKDDFTQIINAYRGYHPYVTVKFKELNLEEAEEALIQGWARDEGPDIFSLPSTWLKKYQEFILPLPSETNVAYYQKKTFLFRETVDIKYIKKASLTTQDLANQYIDIVPQDVILKDNKGKNVIYGLPYSVDTLALYYNKDLLNGAYIIEPARTWTELVNHVAKLTKLDNKNNILQSGLALGLALNVDNYFDILSLLMMQNGAQMLSSDGTEVTFDKYIEGESSAGRALDFYTSFSNLNKESYSWDEKQPQAIDAFKNGKIAYFIGYLSQKKSIEGAVGLNFSIVPMLHINYIDEEGIDRVLNPAGNFVQVNYANYFIETVSKKTKAPNEAWDLVQFIARENRNREYIEKTGKISPLRKILTEQKENQDIVVWVNQALTAKSWYRGRDAKATEDYFAEMINSVALEGTSVAEALNLAAEKIEKTL